MIEIKALLSGILAGISYAVTGYIRAASKGEDFDLKKFLRAVLIGACIGAVSVAMQMPYSEAETFLGQIGATAIIDKIASAIYEKLSKI